MRTERVTLDEVAALAAEVRAVARRQAAILPDEQSWADLMFAFYTSEERTGPVERAVQQGTAGIVAYVGALAVAPGAEALRSALVSALLAAERRDGHAYRRALHSLRLALLEFFAEVGYRWRHTWQGKHLIDLPMQPAPVTVAKGWGVAMLAGRALEVSSRELERWAEWIGGAAAKRHGFYVYEVEHASPTLRGSGHTPSEQWREDCVTGRLPASEENELVQRGVVTQAEVDAVDGLGPIAEGWGSAVDSLVEALDRLPEGGADGG